MSDHTSSAERMIETSRRLKSADFGTFGRYHERPIDEMDAEERRGHDLVLAARGMIPGPYKIWLQNGPLVEAMLAVGMFYQDGSSLSKGEIEIAALLTNAHNAAAYSSYEHEWLAERLGGLRSDAVQALVAGLPTAFEDRREQVVYDATRALLAPRPVPMGLYRRAIELLGHRGLTDVIAIIGYFTTVSMTLRAYDVPASAEGLDR